MPEQKPAHGEFCWNELMSRDVPAAAKFYSALIGWKAEDGGMPGMDYTVFKVGDKMVGGLMAMPTEVPKEVPAHWLSYIAVDDVDATTSKVVALGGQVLRDPADIPQVGRFSVIQDPTGAVVSLFKSAGKE